jgi:uncharacterized protein (DUF1330 family)
MPAYIIVQIDIKDPARYEEYKNLVPASIAKFGGKYIVRGGKVDILEGKWKPSRLVILEFESVQRAKDWWGSEEYREARALRHQIADAQMIVVEGL